MIAYLVGNSALQLSVSKDILKSLHISKILSSTSGALVNQMDKIETLKQKMNKMFLKFGLKSKLPLKL